MPDPQVWPIEAKFGEGRDVIEHYGYATDIITAESGAEQRIGLRRHPVERLEFSFLCMREELREGQIANALLYANLAKKWIVPFFHRSAPLQAAAGIGTNTLLLDTTNIPFRDVLGLGKYAVLWRDADTYEAVQIDVLTTASIQTVNPLTKSWSVPGTWVLPARVGILEQPAAMTWLTSRIASGRLSFTFDAYEETAPGSGDFVILEGGVFPTV